MRDVLDRYYTPDALALACVDTLAAAAGPIRRVLEPSIGGGAFAKALRERDVKRIGGCDVDPAARFDLLDGSALVDFLEVTPADAYNIMEGPTQWIIGNPPYRDAEAHLRNALAISDRHVAFLLRSSFLASQKRSRDLWTWAPLRKVWMISPRPSFTGNGKTDGAEYALIWLDKQHEGPAELGWITDWR